MNEMSASRDFDTARNCLLRVRDTLNATIVGQERLVTELLTGVFATTVINPGGADGLLHGNASLLGVQALSVVVAAAYAAAGTVVILVIVRGLTGLRTCDSAERVGIDVVEHDELAYWREGRAWLSGGLNEALNEAAVVRVEGSRGGSSS